MTSPQRSRQDFPTGLARRLDGPCGRFEAEWQAGGRPRLEDFLEKVDPADRPALMRELLHIELHYRRKQGDQPGAQEYRSRFGKYGDEVTASFAADRSTTTAPPRVAPAQPSTAALPRLPGYEVLGVLGAGGMGQVYKARHRLMDRVVALKVIRQDCLADPTAIRRFHREVQMVAQLAHPNIVLAYDADQAGKTHFFVMEYVAGQTLAQRVKERGPLPIREACDYIAQAAHGLQHAHEHGLVHRDIKPANLIVNEQGVLKILDLGLARAASPSTAAQGMTQEGAILGTVDYMAPEQAQGSRTIDIRADIYSLGCTLYYLLTGKVPFPGGTLVDKLVKLAEQEPAPVTELRPDVPPAVAALVRKLMAKDPNQRYPTPAALVDALAAIERSLRRPRRRLRQVGVAAGFTAVLGVVLFLALPRPGAAPVDQDAASQPVEPPSAPPMVSVDEELAQLAAESADPATSPVVLRDKIIAFCLRNPGQPQAYKAGTLLLRPAPLKNSIGMQLAPIPPGTFIMGAPKEEVGREEDDREWPPHAVEITKPFYLGTFPVTVAEFRMFVVATGYRTTAEKGAGARVLKKGGRWSLDPNANWQRPPFTLKEKLPVACVSWQDAQAFCRWLSEKEGKHYTLPSEAQWEYACRAGSKSRYFYGNLENRLGDYAWHTWNSGTKPHAVGLKQANRWGLHDIAGNVRQWCQDYYARAYYQHHPPRQDPTGPSSGGKQHLRVIRGGACTAGLAESRSAWRYGQPEQESQSNRGFRVALLPSTAAQASKRP